MENKVSGPIALLPCITLALLFVPPAPALARNSCAIPQVTAGDDAVAQFDGLLRGQCLGSTACKTTECELVSKLEAKGVEKPEPTAERVLIVLGKLNDKALTLNATQLGVVPLREMLKRWDMPGLASSLDAVPARILQSNTIEWQGRRFNLFMHTPFALNLEDEFGQCDSAAICQAYFDSAIEVYTLSALIHRTLSTVTEDKIAGVGKMLKMYDQRWTAFHTESRAVFPWELIVNNLFYKSAESGFSGPPDYQWLFLHPSAAMAYDDKQADKLQEAILLDVVGRYRWSWGGKDSAEIAKPWGLALAMSWSGGDPGYGLAVHLPRNWSIGVTRGKTGNTQVLLSVEFAQYVTDKRKTVDDIRKKLDGLRLP